MDVTVMHTPLSQRRQREYAEFLAKLGLRDEGDADLIAWVTDEDYRLIASGALAGNTIKQIGVLPESEGTGVMAFLISELMNEAMRRGISRLFLCTRPCNVRMFSSLGFYSVIETDDAALMENRRSGLDDFLASVPRLPGRRGCIVCKSDPFTLGHRHLIEYAAGHCDSLYVFVVSERGTMFTPEERLAMVRAGTTDIPGCCVLSSDMYLVSRATFPAYFIRDEERTEAVRSDLDIALFCRRIAPALGISIRFAGEEPYSEVTRAYNSRMKEVLPEYGIELSEIPRLRAGDEYISASRVRELISDGRAEAARQLMPAAAYEVLGK